MLGEAALCRLDVAQTVDASKFIQAMTPRFVYRALPLLACFIACTIINLYYFPPTTIFPDETRFLGSAARLIASGEFWAGAGRAWEMPGTALFFTPAVWLFGADDAVIPIRVMQSILLIAQAILAGSIARRLFGKGTAEIITITIVALYPFFLFYQGLLLSETLFTTLLVAAFAALYWWRDRGLGFDVAFVVTCLCFAAATYARHTLTFVPPLLIAATAWLNGMRLRKSICRVARGGEPLRRFAQPLVDPQRHGVRNIRSLRHQRRQISISAITPITPMAASTGITMPILRSLKDYLAIPDELEQQRKFYRLAIDYIEANPGAFFRVAAKKFLRFWNFVPNATEFKARSYSLVSAASFGPVLLLALACALRWWRRWRSFAPIYLMIGYFTLLHVVVIASLRYRLPIEPLLIVMAAGLLAELIDRWRGRAGHAVRRLDVAAADRSGIRPCAASRDSSTAESKLQRRLLTPSPAP